MMNKIPIIVLSFILLVSCSNNKIKWENDFDKAVEKSKSEKKVIMIDIYTDWCGICKEMDKTTFAEKKVIDYTTNFITLKFNPEKASNGNDILRKYNVSGFPTMLFINSNGFVIKKIVGYIESDELLNEMENIKEIEKSIANAFKDENPSIEKLNIYINSGYSKEASEMYEVLSKDNKIPESNKASYMARMAIALLDDNDYTNGMRYFNELIDKYSDYKEVYIAHYYKALDNIISGNTNEGIKYIESLTNKVPAEFKEQYLDFISYFNSNQ